MTPPHSLFMNSFFIFFIMSIVYTVAGFPASASVKKPATVKKKEQTQKMNTDSTTTTPIAEKSGKTPAPPPFDVDNLIKLDVEKYSLENGMTVLLHRDLRIPQIYHQLLIKVGSKDEEKGKTGLAHLFEHMMFRGTARYTGEEYEEKLESMGASNNAFTSRDYTAYEVVLPNHKLELVLQMEAERLNTLNLTQSNFDKEREVVKEERRLRTDNNPNEIFEPVMKLVFESHSYGRPIIGWMEDLEAMSLDDCKEFYKSYYAPNNAILVLAGNFDIKKAKKWIKKYYGALKPAELKSRPSYTESAQTKQRVSRLKRAVRAPTLAFAYRGPKAGEEGSYALEVLNRILTSGESSRLHKLLVYKHKLALSVGGFYYSLRDEGVFLIFIRMTPGAELATVKRIFLAEMNKVLSEDVKDKELLKSARAIMGEYVLAVKTLSGKANSLSLNEAYFEDYRELFRDLGRYYKVSAPLIKKYANLHLSTKKLSTVELLPLNAK